MAKGKFPFGNDRRAAYRRWRPALADPGIPGDPRDPLPWQDEPQPAAEAQSDPRAEDAGWWDPVVIDDPVFDFEPKPPTGTRFYRPDTVFDGWSTEDFTVRLASVRGYSHRYHGVSRQDDGSAAAHQPSGTVMFAAADGVSSASQSHLGATSASTWVIETMRWQLDHHHAIDLPAAVRHTAKRLVAQAASLLRQADPSPGAVEELLATTLVAGYVAPATDGATGAMVQIGDSSAWILADGRYHPVLAQKNDPHAAVISSAVSPLPRVPEGLTPVTFRLLPGMALLVGTDGFGDPLGDGDGKVGHLFAENLCVPPPGRGLAHLLDFSRDTFDDDRTLIVVWPRPDRWGIPR